MGIVLKYKKWDLIGLEYDDCPLFVIEKISITRSIGTGIFIGGDTLFCILGPLNKTDDIGFPIVAVDFSPDFSQRRNWFSGSGNFYVPENYRSRPITTCRTYKQSLDAILMNYQNWSK